jgi:serine O-acetyltransferase
MRLRAGSNLNLARFVGTQLNNLFPADGLQTDIDKLMVIMPSALERLHPIILAVRNFDSSEFNHLHTLQYATFLYLLGREQWAVDSGDSLADRIFCLNRALNSLDLYVAVKMPEVFFISHGLGSVLGAAQYGTRFVAFQNVTVGRIGDDKPVIGENVVLYPGSAVTGNAVIGDSCVLSAGAHVHNLVVPANTLVIGRGRDLVFEPRKRDYAALYFRDGQST